jgi:hypothetical protein
MFLLSSPDPERTKGSTRYFVSLLVNSTPHTAFLAQLLFDLITLLISIIPGFYTMIAYPCYGLWPLIICEICVKCWANPENIMHPCGLPVNVKAKYYPFLFVGLFTLLFWGAAFELGLGLVIGYLSTIYIDSSGKLSKANLPSSWVSKLEYRLKCHCLPPFGRYILLSQADSGLQAPVLPNNPPSDQHFPGTGQVLGP